MSKSLTQEEFLERCKKVHGEKYDFSEAIYETVTKKVKVICPKHGEFYTNPSDLFNGVGCPACGGVKKSNTKEFIEKSRKIYGEKYDYSKVEYKNNKTKVCIICHEKDELGHEHGEFWQRPNEHLCGNQCPKCGKQYSPTTEEWIAKAKIVHGIKYDYSKVIYKSAKEKICIICPIHGEFWQTPNNHLNGNGCPNCKCQNKSKMEENISILLSNAGLNYKRQKTFPWLKHKRQLFLDFYIPYKKIAIEVQGEQHFVAVNKFGGEENLKIQQERDKIKKELCEKKGIKLFYITRRNYNINEILNYIKC